MASKVKKGFLYYLAWFAFICLGIICIFASILVFNPGKDIFGINLCYVSQSGKTNIETIKVNGTTTKLKDLNLENIVINTKSSDVIITHDNYIDQLRIQVKANTTGFARFETYEEYTYSISHKDNTLTLTVSEPIMSLAFNNDSAVRIICPRTFNLSQTNLIFNTNNGSFSMGTSEQFPSVLNSLTINSKNSKVSLYEYSQFISGNVNLNSDKINAHIKCDITGDLNIESKEGKLTLDNINGNLNLYSDSIEANCGVVRGKVLYACDDGFINIGTIGSITSNGAFSSPENTNISNVKINKIYGNVAIYQANKSDVIVNNIEGSALIETTTGNVTIGKSNGEITVNTTSGNVKFTQTNVNALTTINTTSGKINGNFTEVGIVKLLSKKGAVNVNVATDKPFKLDYSTEKSINISFIEKDLEKSDVILIATQNDNGKLMEIVTTNKITIKNGYELE